MDKPFLLSCAIVFGLLANHAAATQADDTSIAIAGQNAGPTPFISQLTLTASDTNVIRSIQFRIAPKAGSVTRPLSGTYARNYLIDRGYLLPPPENAVFLPVYGLYDGFANEVILTYRFLDGSSKTETTTITTAAFSDPCGYKSPTILQGRTGDTTLSYDYMMVNESCDTFAPAVIDTDGTLRWVGNAGISDVSGIFFDNAFFVADGATLNRIDLDGTVTLIHDYSDVGVVRIHHTIERGKTGLILEVDTEADFESTVMEVDTAGKVLKTWSLADIISAAMLAKGDDPSLFVEPPADWFHNNSVAYNRADDSIAVSSRENFVICLDYESEAIKWILGDPTKHWHQLPSLAQYALALAPNSLPPVGQHSVSISYNQELLLFDNGVESLFQFPPGASRPYSSPRRYKLDLVADTATEVWNYEMDQSVSSSFCSSVYEDAPLNYLVDYALVNGLTDDPKYAQLMGLNAAGKKVFYYQYGPVDQCVTAFNSIPLHLEATNFPAVGPQALNLSTRGKIGTGEDALIGGLIISGIDSKEVALRVLGPSLANQGVAGALADPVLTVYDLSGNLVASNDNWQTDPGAAELAADGLAPTEPNEAATTQQLAPGAYTVVATGQQGTSGIGLVEVYDLSPVSSSKLANLSSRGRVETGDDVLISGLIVGEVASSTIVVRALGPSLSAAGVADPLPDPTLTVYDANGFAIAANDNWAEDPDAPDLTKNSLAPNNPAEAAIILRLPAGAYTAVVNGTGNSTGVALVDVYHL